MQVQQGQIHAEEERREQPAHGNGSAFAEEIGSKGQWDGQCAQSDGAPGPATCRSHPQQVGHQKDSHQRQHPATRPKRPGRHGKHSGAQGDLQQRRGTKAARGGKGREKHSAHRRTDRHSQAQGQQQSVGLRGKPKYGRACRQAQNHLRQHRPAEEPSRRAGVPRNVAHGDIVHAHVNPDDHEGKERRKQGIPAVVLHGQSARNEHEEREGERFLGGFGDYKDGEVASVAARGRIHCVRPAHTAPRPVSTMRAVAARMRRSVAADMMLR